MAVNIPAEAAYTYVFVLVNDAVDGPMCGRANGISQTMVSFVRMIGVTLRCTRPCCPAGPLPVWPRDACACVAVQPVWACGTGACVALLPRCRCRPASHALAACGHVRPRNVWGWGTWCMCCP